MTDIWKQIESRLIELYSVPDIRTQLKLHGRTTESTVQHKLKELRSGLNGSPKEETFHGPHTFLRVVGPSNQAYSGEWWFEAKLLEELENGYSRIFFSDSELRDVLRTMLREFLAVSTEWNAMDEVWTLNLPAGQTLTGYSGIGNPQKLFANKRLSDKGNRMLVGRARQLYFPVKNPLWIYKVRQLNL